jgi:general secretion pathway protein L
MSTLIITLPAAAPGATASYDYLVTPDGEAVAGHASVPAALLPPADRGGETVVVVPAARLSWHAVDLPKGVGAGSARLRPVLDSLLEDRLLDEPGQLHLALAPDAGKGSRTWVAACDKAWLQAHLQTLEAAQRPVTRIVPELAPDAGPTRLQAVGEPDQAWLLVTGEAAAAGVLVLPLAPAALALLPRQEDADAAPVQAEPGVAELAEQVLQRRVNLQQRLQHMLQAARSAWDLAQFDLARSGRARTLKLLGSLGRELRHAPAWRPARWGAALLVGANLVGLNAWAWKEQSALAARRAAIRDTLTQTFPQVRVVVDAPLQMAREVAALRQATGAASGRDLEAMLSAIGKALPVDPAAMPDLAARLHADGYTARLDGDSLLIQPEPAR